MMSSLSLTEEPQLDLSIPNSVDQIFGRTEPRIFTPPLRELTPETSYGFDVIDFARDILKEPLDPWQEWLVIHMGELLENGSPRFRQILVIVARQNGKTHLLRVLALFWQFQEQWPLILGTSANLVTARETWEKAADIAKANPVISRHLAGDPRRTNGQEALTSVNDDGSKSRYIIKAANASATRGFTVDRLILDELREHKTWEAWNASFPTTSVPRNAQTVAITNQGDEESVVLISLRDAGIKAIREGTSDFDREGLFEWSAPEGSDILDPNAWAYANPNLGYRLPIDSIRGPALRAVAAGGLEESGFRTEILCMQVTALDAAINARAWEQSYKPKNLLEIASQTSWCFDVAPDYMTPHATLTACLVGPDGVTHGQLIKEWHAADMPEVTADLLKALKRFRPKNFGWFPKYSAASYTKDLSKPNLVPGVNVSELSKDIPAVCMGFEEAVKYGRVTHNNDDITNVHVTSAQKKWTGDTWVFNRRGKASSDAAYSFAGAFYLANTTPPAPTYQFIGPED